MIKLDSGAFWESGRPQVYIQPLLIYIFVMPYVNMHLYIHEYVLIYNMKQEIVHINLYRYIYIRF